MFFDNNGVKLEINNRKVTEKSANNCKVALQNNPWDKNTSQGEIRKYF